jgi:hypothetical protein
MTLSVIDSISKGFRMVHRYWWLLLLPVLLDTFLWIGPQASIQQLTGRTLEGLEAEVADLPAEGMDEWWEEFRLTVAEAVSQYNGFTALRVGALGIPSLMTWQGARLGSPSIYETLWILFALMTDRPDLLVSVQQATFVAVPVWQYPSQAAWLFSTLLLSAVGVLVGCVFLAVLSHGLDAEEPKPTFGARVLRLAGRFVLFWVLRAAVLMLAGIPLVLLLFVLGALSPALASLFGSIVLGLITWLSFYGIFFVASLTIDNVSVWRAVWNSFNVVIRNFWATFGLFLLVNLIGGGMTILWQRLSTGSWWTWIAIVGNAYVGTSLVAASLAFYQDRYDRWREMIAQLLAGSNRRPA